MRTVVIIGAQKARTSTLASSFAAHPDIYLHPREVALFEHPYATGNPAGEFVGMLARRPEPVVGFKRADLLGRPEAPGNVRAALGAEVHIVASLRHPVDRALSAYYWYVRQGLVPAWDVNRTVRALLADGALDGFPRSAEVLRYGLYSSGIARFEEVFGPRAVTVAPDDGWTPAVLAGLGRELGVQDLAIRPGVHEKRGSYSTRRARFTALGRGPTGRCPSWRAGPADGSYPAAVERRLRDVVDDLVLRRVISDDHVAPDVVAGLAAYYQEDLARVRARHGIELVSRWLEAPTGPAPGASPGRTGPP